MTSSSSASLHLPPRASSCARARRFVRIVLADWGLDPLADDAMLHTSELVANGVLHAGTELTLVLHRRDGRVRVEVVDGSTRMPRVRSTAPYAPNGWGLQIVAAGAVAWGADARPGGKSVWFELDDRVAGDGHAGARTAGTFG